MVGSIVWVIGHGWVVGPVFGSWVTVWVSGGYGLWIGVVVGCGLWIGVVVGRGRGSAWLGRGWVVAEVAPVMTFFEWVCSGF